MKTVNSVKTIKLNKNNSTNQSKVLKNNGKTSND